MPEHESLKQTAREVVGEMVKGRVGDADYLVSSGLIDSLSVLTLISSLEKRLRIRIPKEQVQPEDFDSVDLIVETIERVAQP